MAPAKPAAAKPLRECVVIDQKLQHRTPKALSKQTSRHSRPRDKAPIGQECSVGGEHVYVRVEVDENCFELEAIPLTVDDYRTTAYQFIA